MDKEQALAMLSQKFTDVKCHSMADMAKQHAVSGFDGKQKAEKLLESEFYKKTLGHSKSQDVTAELVALANIIIDAPADEAIGRELVRFVQMDSASRKVRLRDPAMAAKTAHGIASKGKGTTTKYVTLNPQKEFESHSSWDTNFLEDADYDVAMEETGAIATALKEKESQTIITELDEVSAGSLNGGAVYSANSAGTFSFNDIVNMRQNMLSNSVRPNALVLNPLQMGDLMKEEVFQNSLRFGESLNKSEGYIGKVLGMDVYETSQIPDGHILMMDKNNVMLYGVRRDSMLEPFEEVQDGNKTYGAKISTRYDLQLGDGRYLLRCENA